LAEYLKNAGEIKIHTLYDLESLCPEKIFMTTGKPHDGKLTNRFDLTALEIANLYTFMWEIEEFFKRIKQHLKIKKFFGTSENAVLIQILTALIVYVLLLLMQKELDF
jgi:IS4 transposase